MPAPLYGADDPRRCSGNSVSEVLDKFRKNYDLIMSLPQETKEEKEFRHCIWLAEKEERERIYQTSIRPFRKATYTHFLKLTRACVITDHAMALSVMTEELTMKTMKLNIDLGKYVITGTKHDLILSERGIIKEGENAGKETLSRIGYYSKFEHLVKELCNREILLSQAQTLQDIQQHIDTLGVSLSMAIDQFVESKS